MTRRITAALLGLIVLLLAGVVVPLGLHAARSDRQLFADRAAAAANAAAAAAEERLTDRSPSPTVGDLPLGLPVRAGDTVTVYNRTGGVTSRVGATAVPVDAGSLAAALAGRTTVGPASRAEDVLAVAVPVRSGSSVVGALSLQRDAGQLDVEIRNLWLSLGAAALVAALLAAAIAVALARWVARPLRALDRTATRFGAGALGERAPTTGGPPELRTVAVTFNGMADQLASLLAGHRAFLADVSHQLRTPLASMRLRLELLREDVDPATAEELAQALAETHRLSRMLDGLLAVARAENDASHPTPVDVGDVLADRGAAWRPVAEEAGIELRLETPTALVAHATREHLEQALDNLIANAVAAVPAGGLISLVGARRTAPDGQDLVRITVADSGPGMSQQQKSSAFRRFWSDGGGERPDRGGRRGSGLGLAIVHRLVTADGGTIHLADAETGGLAAHLDLQPPPRRAANPPAGAPQPGLLEQHDIGLSKAGHAPVAVPER